MNTKVVKVLIGAAVGGGIGYFVGSVIAEVIKVKEEYLEEEVSFEMEELEELGSDLNENFKTMTKNQKKLEKNQRKIKNYSEYFKSQNRPDLAALAAKYNDGNPVETMETLLVLRDNNEDEPELPADTESEDEWETQEETVETNGPVIVSLADYANNDSGFECITLNYYDDDVVTDPDDLPISHVEQLIGDDALVSFGTLSGDEDVVYIRNLAKKAMYEVVRLNKNYSAHQERLARKAVSKRIVKKEEDNDNG